MFVKCPKCELNYMDGNDRMCKVCYREIFGSEMPEEPEVCGVCNEAPVMAGKDVCAACFKDLSGERVSLEDVEPVIAEDDSVSTMDEIVPEITDGENIAEPEFHQMEKDLSLEELEEKEDRDSQDEDENDDV